MDLLYHHAKYGGDHGLRAGCRRKSVMFCFLFLSRFGMTTFVIAYRKRYDAVKFSELLGLWCHCIEENLQLCACIQLFLWTQRISLRGKFVQKNIIFHDF